MASNGCVSVVLDTVAAANHATVNQHAIANPQERRGRQRTDVKRVTYLECRHSRAQQKVLRWPPPCLLILFSAASTYVDVADGRCTNNQFQTTPIVVNCIGTNVVSNIKFDKSVTNHTELLVVPVGVPGVQIQLVSGIDTDLKLIDSDGTCIVGFNCRFSDACVNETDYCISYAGMKIYFSGDNRQNPVEEAVRIRGSTTRSFSVVAQAFGKPGGSAEGLVKWKNDAFEACPDILPGCSMCASYPHCAKDEKPLCDGMHEDDVICLPPTTTTTQTRTLTSTTVSSTRTITATTTTCTCPGSVCFADFALDHPGLARRFCPSLLAEVNEFRKGFENGVGSGDSAGIIVAVAFAFAFFATTLCLLVVLCRLSRDLTRARKNGIDGISQQSGSCLNNLDVLPTMSNLGRSCIPRRDYKMAEIAAREAVVLATEEKIACVGDKLLEMAFAALLLPDSKDVEAVRGWAHGNVERTAEVALEAAIHGLERLRHSEVSLSTRLENAEAELARVTTDRNQQVEVNAKLETELGRSLADNQRAKLLCARASDVEVRLQASSSKLAETLAVNEELVRQQHESHLRFGTKLAEVTREHDELRRAKAELECRMATSSHNKRVSNTTPSDRTDS